MDILSLIPHSRKLPILHPATKQPTGIVLTLCPGTDPRVQAVSNENRRMLEDYQGAGGIISDEQTKDNALKLFAAMVIDWTWPEGVELGSIANPECTPENVKQFLGALDWAYLQVIEASKDEKAFFADHANVSA